MSCFREPENFDIGTIEMEEDAMMNSLVAPLYSLVILKEGYYREVASKFWHFLQVALNTSLNIFGLDFILTAF